MKIIPLFDKNKICLDLKNCSKSELDFLKKRLKISLRLDRSYLTIIDGEIYYFLSVFVLKKEGFKQVDFTTFKDVHQL